MALHTITPEQIQNQGFGEDNDIFQDGFMIQRYDDHPNQWAVYLDSEAFEPGIKPIIDSHEPRAIVEFLTNY